MKSDNKLIERIEHCIKNGQPKKARHLCNTLCKNNNNNPHAWYLMCAVQSMLHEYNAAEASCRKFIELVPNNPIAQYNLALILQQQNKTDESIHYLQNTIRMQPDYIDAYLLLGKHFLKQNKYSDAIKTLNNAIQKSPNNEQVIINLAHSLDQAKKPLDATRLLQTALKKHANSTTLIKQLAELELNNKNPAESLLLYKQISELEPHSKQIYEKIAYIQLLLNIPLEALETYEKLTTVDPTDISNWIFLLRLCSSQSLFDKAHQLCETALQHNPNNAELLCELGKILSEQGENTDAARIFEQAKLLSPNNEEIDYFLSTYDTNRSSYKDKQKYIASIFNEYASSFDEHLTSNLNYNIPELIYTTYNNAFTAMNKKIDILDLGCGTGLCGQLFKDKSHRLSGIDLASNMIKVAQQLNIYTDLSVDDIVNALEDETNAFDLIIAADVFIYVGDLSNVFSGCENAIRGSGHFIFSVESIESKTYALRTSGRYGHNKIYIENIAQKHNFRIIQCTSTTIRNEGTKPIPGYVYLLEYEA